MGQSYRVKGVYMEQVGKGYRVKETDIGYVGLGTGLSVYGISGKVI